MIIQKILYSKTFPHPANGQWEKVALEAEITPDEDVRSCLYALKKEVEQFHYQSLGHDEKIATEQKTAALDENGVAIAEILLCKTIKDLKGFELMVKNSKSDAVKSAFNQKTNELNSKKKVKLP